jgi:thiamine kinase-like enzyme
LAIGKDEESRKKAAGIVKNLIEMTKLLDKEKKSADFLIQQLQKANTLLQNAVTAGLRPESRTEGVEQQLEAIEQGVGRIRKWLVQDA